MLRNGNSFWSAMPPVTKNLIIINVIIWIAMIVLPASTTGKILDIGGLHYWKGNDFHVAQLFTYMFMHDTGSIAHLFFNMFALWMFGRTLEYELGPKRFLVYYMICGVGAALIQAGIAWAMHEPMTLVGASGAVMGLLLAFGVLHPNAVIMLIFPPIPMKAKWFVIIYGVIELFLGWRGGGNVAHFAHVGGMLWGLLLLYWWRRRGIIRF